MNKISFLIAMLFAANAFAAGPSNEVSPIKKAEPVSKVATVDDSVLADKVNPYTGVRTTIENKKLLLDSAQLSMDLAIKQFELGKQQYLLDNKDKLYKKEVNDRLGLGIPGGAPTLSGADFEDIPVPKSKSKKTIQLPTIETMPAAFTMAPPVPENKVLGIVTNGLEKNAILQVNGNVINAKANTKVSGVIVGAITDESVEINGQKINLTVAANTFNNPDKQTLTNAPSATQGSEAQITMNPQVPIVQGFDPAMMGQTSMTSVPQMSPY